MLLGLIAGIGDGKAGCIQVEPYYAGWCHSASTRAYNVGLHMTPESTALGLAKKAFAAVYAQGQCVCSSYADVCVMCLMCRKNPGVARQAKLTNNRLPIMPMMTKICMQAPRQSILGHLRS